MEKHPLFIKEGEEMFCFNCGAKVIDGAKFCSNCGANLNLVIVEDTNIRAMQEISTFNTESIDISKKEESYTDEQIIEMIFADIFKSRRQFSDSVYIIGKDPISQEIKRNLQEYYLSENPAEKPLLVFDYDKTKLKEGFVITNQRLVWYFPTTKQQEIELTEIKEVLVGKAVLATVMNVVSFDNIKYKNIYLTGIREETEFVLKFRKFIDCIHDVFYGDDEDNKTYETDFIIQICNRDKINSTYCEVGHPVILASSKKYSDAKVNFQIPDKEDIFLIYDSTVFGGCRKGFAICTTGIYYCENKKGYIDWEQFRSVDISLGFSGLKIANELFVVSGSGKQLLMILKSIQEYLR